MDSRSENDHFYIRRSFVAIIFQSNWYAARLLVILAVYVSNDWITVLVILISAITLTFFLLKNKIWSSKIVKNHNIHQGAKIVSFGGQMKNCYSNYTSISVLSLTWFTLGYNYYGLMNSWKNLFAHSALSNFLGLFGKVMAFIICLCVRRKILPTVILQIVTGGCYLALIFLTVPKENGKVDPTSVITIFIVHITNFINSAVFSLVWCITPETFPKNYRYMFMNLNYKLHLYI